MIQLFALLVGLGSPPLQKKKSKVLQEKAFHRVQNKPTSKILSNGLG